VTTSRADNTTYTASTDLFLNVQASSSSSGGSTVSVTVYSDTATPPTTEIAAEVQLDVTNQWAFSLGAFIEKGKKYLVDVAGTNGVISKWFETVIGD